MIPESSYTTPSACHSHFPAVRLMTRNGKLFCPSCGGHFKPFQKGAAQTIIITPESAPNDTGCQKLWTSWVDTTTGRVHSQLNFTNLDRLVRQFRHSGATIKVAPLSPRKETCHANSSARR